MNGGMIAHFAHQPGSDCPHGLESAIHLAAKQLIEERRKLFIPELTVELLVVDAMGNLHKPSAQLRKAGVSAFDAVRLEAWVSDFRPDLIVTEAGGRELLVEIAVTHFVDELKLVKIERQGVPAIELNVSDIQVENFDHLEKLLFEQSTHTRWLFHPDIITTQEFLHAELAPRLKSAEVEASLQVLEEQEQASELQERINHAKLRKVELAKSKRHKAEKFKAMPTKEKLAFTLSYLEIDERQLPDFLDIDVRGGKSFGVPRRVWQTSVFGAFVEKSLETRGAFKLEAVLEWLIQRYDVTPVFPNSEKVALWDFLSNLSQLGILRSTREQWFEVRQDNLKSIIKNTRKVAQNVLPATLATRKAEPRLWTSLSELEWTDNWPSPKRTSSIAKRYAPRHTSQASWKHLEVLLPIAKEKSPDEIASYYSSGNPSAAAIVLDFLVEAGFLNIKE
jgi:hypothetical protein